MEERQEAMGEQTYSGTYKAAVIGHTGRGNYGHGLDQVWVGLPGIQLVALADADDEGRKKALARTGGPRGYANYREMLETERPDLLAIGPRQVDQREEMFMAAVKVGVKAIYTEKPFGRSLDEADRILAACEAKGIKVAVAHQNRAFPGQKLVRQLISEGKIGRLRAIKAYGKQDRRGGGQDLMVLGTHMLDLMRSFAGPARWCHARVAVDGHDATPAAVRPAEEHAGLVAGDDLFATYGFENGVTGSYESMQADDGGKGNYFRIEFCGTGGILCIWSSATLPAYFYPRPFALPDEAASWEVLPLEPMVAPEGVTPSTNGMHLANQAIARSLVVALEKGGEPLSSARDAIATLEMIMAVYESHIQGDRVALPLARREHPLASWK